MTAKAKKKAGSPRRISAGLMVLAFLVANVPGCQSVWDDITRKPKDDMPLEEVKIFRTSDTTIALATSLSEDRISMPLPDTRAVTWLNRIDTKPAIQRVDEKPFYLDLIKEKNRPVFVNLDFVNGVSIPEMVGIFATHLNFQFSVDKEVSGMLSISIAQEMTPEQLWRLLDRLLWMNNAYFYYEDGVVWVRSASKMPNDRGIQPNRENPTNITVRVFRLKSVEAKGVAESLKQFVGQGGLINEIAGQNSLLIIDDAQNMIKLAELIDMIDQISDTDWHRALFYVENIAPTRLSSELSNILTTLGFPVSAASTSTTTSGSSGMGTIRPTFGSSNTSNSNSNARFGAIRMVALERVKGLLVTAATKEAIDEVTQWVRLLDNADHSGQEQVFYYPVINNKASTLAELLKTVFNLEVNILAPEKTQTASEGGTGRSTTTDNTSSRMTQSNSSGNTGSTNRNTTNDNNGPASVFEVPGKVTANDESNYVLVRATPQVYSMMKAVLDRIDIVPAQVELQVVISEIRLDDNMSLGAEFGGKDGNNYIGTDFADLTQTINENTGKRSPGDPGFSYMWSTDDKYAYFNAQASKGRVEIIASPTVMVKSNSTAQVNIGEEVPIITSMYTNTASITPDYSSTNNSVEYKKTGVILEITPRITRGGLIQVDFVQTLSEVQPTTSSSIQSPTILNRQVQSTMSLRNGSTLVVGGLINNVRKSNVSSLPILTDIPILNFLFGTNSDKNSRTELVVLVTGRIVNEETPLEMTVARYKKAINLVRESERSTIREISSKPSPYTYSIDPAEREYAARQNAELIENVRIEDGPDVKVMLIDDKERSSNPGVNYVAPAKVDEIRQKGQRLPDGTILLPKDTSRLQNDAVTPRAN